MRLKHLEQGIHLPHTSKYHPDAIDIYCVVEKMAKMDKLHHEKNEKRKKKGKTGEEMFSSFVAVIEWETVSAQNQNLTTRNGASEYV